MLFSLGTISRAGPSPIFLRCAISSVGPVECLWEENSDRGYADSHLGKELRPVEESA